MEIEEIQKRLNAVLQSFDTMSSNNSLQLNGLNAIQTFAGCIGIINEIATFQPTEEQK